MLYRITNNDFDFLSLVYDDEEVIEKLGEDNLIQIECDPRAYAPIWQKLSVRFEPALGGKSDKPIPDLQVHSGHIFLSERALKALKGVLELYGELLPVVYRSDNEAPKEGAIFNPLKIVSANERTSTKDSFGEVTSLFFDSEEVIFKTDFDDYFGLYCSNEFQRLIEANALTGMELIENLASYETQINTRM
ncbi:hypothetical protein [Thalassolituus sp.]|uniref:hypothetical protein n=1 Tax=Thalassolituus sp. TaxID=2030822 RepID=UPI00262DAA38|nr:hypothetical protein [Thalassolituus sp.]